MRQTILITAATAALVLVLDLAVAGALALAGRMGQGESLVRYFDYGRSVPGKQAAWLADPGQPGDMFAMAWTPEILAASATDFAAEDPAAGPVLRSYGMSFVNDILRAATAQDPALIWDKHAGPAGPPNFTFDLFLADRANRRAGDIAVLGILSSSVPGMAALSNQTWVFEQPAPFTYPVFWPEGPAPGLSRTAPQVVDRAAARAAVTDPAARRAWHAQLREIDAFYGPVTFGAGWLDHSPFARLVRRSLATSHEAEVKAEIVSGAAGYPYAEVLRRMTTRFAALAREDGQRPLVLLIQTGAPGDADLRAILAAHLEAGAIPYLATADHQPVSDPAAFVADGHYTRAVNARFGTALLGMVGE